MGFYSRSRQQPEPTPKIEGLLGYYGLAEWWLAAFSADEREYIEASWGYITFRGHPIWDERPLTRGPVTSNPLSPADFLMVMSRRASQQMTERTILPKVRELRGGDLPGYIKGTHYTIYLGQAKQLLESGKAQDADLLVDLAFTGLEDSARIGPLLTEYFPIPPANYFDFAVLYRKLKDYAREVMILERFAGQKHLTEGASGKTLERLEKARSLRDSD